MTEALHYLAALGRFRESMAALASEIGDEGTAVAEDMDLSVERRRCVQALAAAEQLVRETCGNDKRVTGPFFRLMIALKYVEDGRDHPLLRPAHIENRIQLPIDVMGLRGRVAAIQEMLMRDSKRKVENKKKADKAAQDVFRLLGEDVVKRLRFEGVDKGVDWKMVAGWRRKVREAAPGSSAKEGYLAMQALMALDPSDEATDARAKRHLATIARAAVEIIHRA